MCWIKWSLFELNQHLPGPNAKAKRKEKSSITKCWTHSSIRVRVWSAESPAIAAAATSPCAPQSSGVTTGGCPGWAARGWGLGCQACFFVHRPRLAFSRLAPVARPLCRNLQYFNETGGIRERSEQRHQGFDAQLWVSSEGRSQHAFVSQGPLLALRSELLRRCRAGSIQIIQSQGSAKAGHISALPQPAWPPSPRSFACCPHGGRHLSRWRISSPLTSYQGSTAEPAPTQLSFSLCLKRKRVKASRVIRA
jgi:hypothetical protein